MLDAIKLTVIHLNQDIAHFRRRRILSWLVFTDFEKRQKPTNKTHHIMFSGEQLFLSNFCGNSFK